MDPIKIAIFLAAFLLLLFIGRMLARAGEVHASQLPPPQPGAIPGTAEPVDDRRQRRQPAVVGSEIEFPIQLSPVRQLEDGTYNRPHITNYFFLKTDLITGPAEPNCLFDKLYVEGIDPGNDLRLTYRFTVATPPGLLRAMDEEKLASLYIEGGPVVIVPRWDLRLILQTVMDEIIRTYGANPEDEEEEEESEARESGS